ncbi:MAG TPA: hypothetical protein VL173_05485 [Vicinamibacterales bacterium]|jgi:hypothetical protein|nr:hypothetical protein [Vicinamibacterales bacterium]
MARLLTSSVVAIALALAACGSVGRIAAPSAPPPAEQLAELWTDPGTTPRDLFWGLGGEKYAPAKDAIYQALVRDDRGFSVTYDVTDPDGVEWSAKIGPEAQTEVVLSRILWGLGYHQPPIYYLPKWNVAVAKAGVKVEGEARFRPKLPQVTSSKDLWHWAENPFLGAPPLRGLLVILLMFNSTDLKDDNNRIYDLQQPWDGTSRWFMVRDLGASLGETGKVDPRRNWWLGFEKHAFITAVVGDRVQFDYGGLHKELLTMIRPDDVRWAAQQLARLTEQQWHDAFRAANYAQVDADRYIGRLKEKIEDGLALRVDRRAARD